MPKFATTRRGSSSSRSSRPTPLHGTGYLAWIGGRHKNAIELLLRAIGADPKRADAQLHLAACYRDAGNLDQAIASAMPPLGLSTPRWNGEDAPGEQGYGDTIQFVRFVPLAAKRVGKVIVRAQPAMDGLLRESLPDSIEVASDSNPPPEHDLHIPMMSLALVLGTTLATIPAQVPYLRAPADRAERWSSRLPRRASHGLRVGVAWAGSIRHGNDPIRSLDPAQLAPLAAVEGITWVSLQKDRRGTPPFPMLDLTSDIADFADAAALVQQLDLVISVDTAIAHLAGALARPTWALLPFAPEWRWLNDRTDSPWYPTMRLFRQPAVRDWASVIAQVAQELRTFKRP